MPPLPPTHPDYGGREVQCYKRRNTFTMLGGKNNKTTGREVMVTQVPQMFKLSPVFQLWHCSVTVPPTPSSLTSLATAPPRPSPRWMSAWKANHVEELRVTHVCLHFPLATSQPRIKGRKSERSHSAVFSGGGAASL